MQANRRKSRSILRVSVTCLILASRHGREERASRCAGNVLSRGQSAKARRAIVEMSPSSIRLETAQRVFGGSPVSGRAPVAELLDHGPPVRLVDVAPVLELRLTPLDR